MRGNKNRRAGPVNTNWGGGTMLVYASPGSGLTGPVNTNWGPGLGAKQKAGCQEIQMPRSCLEIEAATF